MNEQKPAGEMPAPGRRRFKRFTALSRRLLYYANEGAPRAEFLRESSRMLLEFTGCNSLELWMNDVEITYRWKAVFHNGDGDFNFETISTGPGDRQKEPVENPGIHQLYLNIINQSLNLSSPYFIHGGEIFPGDTPHMKTYLESLLSSKDYPSAAVIQFYVGEKYLGLLILKSRQEGHFNIDNTDFYEGAAQTMGIAIANRRAQAALKERIKELGCMYGICRTLNIPGLKLKSILRRIVELLPPAMQYPEISSARIVLDGGAFRTPRFKGRGKRLKANLIIHKNKRGFVEVIYEEPDHQAKTFLKEEMSLLENVAHNISLIIEQKEAEEEKERLEKQLRHADRLATIGELAAGVAHELNEPIGNILGFAQLAGKAPDLPEQAVKDLDRIVKSSLYVREIVKKLLMFARQAPTMKGKVDMNYLAEDVLSFFTQRFHKESIEVVFNRAEALPEITADISQMRQVLMNLVVNAMQAMPGGGVLTITTQSAGKNVAISVEDTGEGISKRVMKQIFVPFFTTKRPGMGTGLGLPVVHGIVTSHGGTIQVESRPGKGSRFEVTLPVDNNKP